LRKECPELGWGAFRVLGTGSPNVLALSCTWRGNTLVCLHNFAAEARGATIELPEAAGKPLTNLLTRDHRAPDRRGRHRLELNPYGYHWFRVGPLLDVIEREPS